MRSRDAIGVCRPRAGCGTALCSVGLVLWAGCSHRNRQPGVEMPPPESPRPATTTAATAAAAARPAPAASSASPRPSQFNSPVAPAPAGQTAPGPEDKGADDEKPRDFTAELERMIGRPSECLKPRTADRAPGRVDIGLIANVMPSGAVRHGEVSCRALQSEELACVQRRLEALHFAPPIENAPFSVRGTLQLELPLARGAVVDTNAPPAATADGRTPGIVPPADPGIVPPADPGVVPPPDPGVVPPGDPGIVPPPDPPAEVLYPQ